MKHNPIICALDTSNYNLALEWIESVKEFTGMVKVGLELFTSSGLPFMGMVAVREVPVFLDLKFYDIPNTVTKTIEKFLNFKNIEMLTVHGSADSNMIEAAVDVSDNIDVIAVTVLTSSKKTSRTLSNVKKITEKALKAGAAGVVCSAKEVQPLRKTFGTNLKIIVPGIRPTWYKSDDDQQRTGTPKEVLNKGADYLVIGRPITTNENPKNITYEILREIENEKRQKSKRIF